MYIPSPGRRCAFGRRVSQLLRISCLVAMLGWLTSAFAEGQGVDPGGPVGALQERPGSTPWPILGEPPLVNFRLVPDRWLGSRQTWAITQDADGVLYVGSSGGLFEFDGTRWTQIPGPKSTIRSLDRDAAGTIYVGGQGQIGYLDAEAAGGQRYVSLLDQVAESERDFTDVWKTHATSQGVFFQSFEKILHWHEGALRTLYPQGTFHFSFVVDGVLYVRDTGQGLTRFHQGRLQLLPQGERFKDERVYAMLPWEPGKILLASRTEGLFVYDGEEFLPWQTDADDFLKASHIYHGVVLWDGTIALGTIRGGLILLDRTGRVVRVFDRRSGLIDASIKFLQLDQERGLWVAHDKGITWLDLPAAWTLFDERAGLLGLANEMQRVGDFLYLGTSHGVFSVALNDAAEAPERPLLKPVAGVKAQAFTLLALPDRLLAATIEGVFEIRGEEGRRIFPGRASSILRSKQDPQRFYVSLFDGLASIRRQGDGWHNEGRWPTVQGDVRSLVEDPTGDLWLGTKSRQVLRLDSRQGVKARPELVTGPGSALPDLEFTWLFESAGDVRCVGADGVYRRQGSSWVRVAIEGLNNLEEEPLIWVREQDLDTWWVAKEGTYGQARREAAGTWRFEQAPSSPFGPDSVFDLLQEPAGALWVVRAEGVLRREPRLDRPAAAPRVLIRGISSLQQSDEGLEAADPSAPKEQHVVPWQQRSLRFQLTVPQRRWGQSIEFQSWLEGYDDGWTSLQEQAHQDFVQLSPGEYRLRLRARDRHGKVGPETSYDFRIVAPWYRQKLFLGLLALALGVLLFVAGRSGWHHAQRRARRDLDNLRRKEELEAARRLQRQLLPRVLPQIAGLDMAARQETATEVGGDYYDVFPQPSGDVYLVLGDATGHGLGAGLMVVATKAALLALDEPHPQAAVAKLNKVLHRVMIENRMHMALVLCHLSPTALGWEFIASGGGAVPIHVWRRGGAIDEVWQLEGLPLGALATSQFGQVGGPLAAGDVVILMTDGLPETVDPDGELLGYERLRQRLAFLAERYRDDVDGWAASRILSEVWQISRDWAQTQTAQLDDLTVVVIKVGDPAGGGLESASSLEFTEKP